ncbi:hypothetical protein KUTeg_001550, partial [Tegillarca granosa]
MSNFFKKADYQQSSLSCLIKSWTSGERQNFKNRHKKKVFKNLQKTTNVRNITVLPLANKSPKTKRTCLKRDDCTLVQTNDIVLQHVIRSSIGLGKTTSVFEETFTNKNAWIWTDKLIQTYNLSRSEDEYLINHNSEPVQRAAWGNQIEFILTMIGFAVGIGNIWRFPYLCYRNGGGAFLIPYFVSMFVIGGPIFYLEIAFGQFASLGPLKIWRANPAFKGLGYAMVIVSGLIALYYCVIISWCIYFFFASMTSNLPWNDCNNVWNQCTCRDGNQNDTLLDPWNGTRPECRNHHVLESTGSIEIAGGVKWDLALCLLLAWTLTFIVLSRGVESLGKVVYFTALFPYVLLTALLVRGATLDGHMDGIKYYLTPDFSKLLDANVWADAAVQIFYSLSCCQGGLMAMASYNNFKNMALRDTIMVPIINCLTSFYAGFVIFSVLGFMAKSKGTGLAFVVYPEGIAQMPISPLWSIMFFFMMMTLGFSSLFSITETVITGFADELGSKLNTRWKRVGYRFAICATAYLLGLPMVTRGGSYLLDVVDTFVGGFPLLIIGFLECVVIIYIYGFFRFKEDIEMMLGRSIPVQCSFVYFGIMWCIITPIGLLHYPVAAGPEVLCCQLNSPRANWGPAKDEHRTGRYCPREMIEIPDMNTKEPVE